MAIRNNPFKPFIKKIPAPFKNRFFLALAFLVFWLSFIDKNDVWTQYQLQQTLNKLKEDKKFYEIKIGEVKQQRLDIDLNKEKFAREKYFMKKKNEDVFIMLREEGE